jgi:hypothetical protein
MDLQKVRSQIQQKLNLLHKELILKVYQNAINSHNEFCGCNYCLLLEKYVLTKKSNHRFFREYEIQLDNNTQEISIEEEYVRRYRTEELKIKQLKIEKDKLKQL